MVVFVASVGFFAARVFILGFRRGVGLFFGWGRKNAMSRFASFRSHAPQIAEAKSVACARVVMIAKHLAFWAVSLKGLGSRSTCSSSNIHSVIEKPKQMRGAMGYTMEGGLIFSRLAKI